MHNLERVNFERKSAEKAYVEKQLSEIRATINELVGKKLFKFEEPRSIAKETADAVRDIAEDYDFFREAYQDTAQSLRDNIVELVKTLNQGNKVIDYDSIQNRVDALKYLSEDQQREQIKQTRKLIADDYEALVKRSRQEAKLLARSYDAENDWQQVETKIKRLLAPEGSIEHSRESLKLINDFFRMTKSSMRKLQEEEYRRNDQQGDAVGQATTSSAHTDRNWFQRKKDNLIGKYEDYRRRERDIRKLWRIEGLDGEFDWEYIPPSGSKL